MLTHILVKDLAIVSSLELDLTSGMTALTGETGAGKSILIDALGLALGDRADNAMIRAGRERAEITAVFDVTALQEVADWLREHSLDNGGECILRRVLVRDGRSRAFVNGSPAPIQSLQELGQQLVDIHGQHAHQSLLRRPYQRRLLDEYGAHQGLAAAVATLYRRFRAVETRLSDLQNAAQERAERLDLLRYQWGELETLNLGENELEELNRDHSRLANTEHLQIVCAQVIDSLYESEASIQNQLVGAIKALQEPATLDTTLAGPAELLDNALIQIEEANAGLRDYLDSLEMDPAVLRQLDERLAQIHDLARKYRVDPEQLRERMTQLSQELAQLESADSRLDELRQEMEGLRAEFFDRAKQLSAARNKAAQALSATVTDAMQVLGMSKGRFSIELLDLSEDNASATGLEQVEFMVSANPGQPPQPLAKVASGGELSRISLAIQVATAQCGNIPSLIFDEVDVGIGGGVAEIVGQMLRSLGKVRQVLCVTHLPQVAAMGHHHLQVSKSQSENETHTDIALLREEQRISEIARMLGGIDMTKQTLAHAREMIDHSQQD